MDLYAQPASGSPTWSDLSALASAPAPAADPVPFFDPSGNVDVIYVNSIGQLVILCANDPLGPTGPTCGTWTRGDPEVAVNLSALSGVSFANGLASVQVNGAERDGRRSHRGQHDRGPVDRVGPGRHVPYLSAPPVNVSTLTNGATATSDPVVLATSVPEVVATAVSGDLELFSQTGTPATPWVLTDLSKVTTGPKVERDPGGVAATTTEDYVAALSTNGTAILFRRSIGDVDASGHDDHHGVDHHDTPAPSTAVVGPWGFANLTGETPGAPPLSGSLFVAATASQVVVAGQAADWGDLFAISGTGASGELDRDGRLGDRGQRRAHRRLDRHGLREPGLASTSSPPASPRRRPRGSASTRSPRPNGPRRSATGWPILSETGGLGTQASPWVGFTGSATVATSPDFLMGQSIYNSHKRVTWLSFWTVSGPGKGETKKAATYYSHGFAAGVWVATQIDQYRGLGVGLKPDWVIFDPEGYPDDHSGLDAPGGPRPRRWRPTPPTGRRCSRAGSRASTRSTRR